MTTDTLDIHSISGAELARLRPALAALLVDAVDGGASLGFLAPLATDAARGYWRSLAPELEAGRRIVVVARVGARVVGSGQLALPTWPNARHRAEVQKLFVDATLRGQGVGRSLMDALHDAARRRGRRLLLLGARRADPAVAFYKAIGYQEAGVIPGYAIDASGVRHDNVSMYHELAP
jgi:ribosomal protein S18 acetylase RimI-like enzyme